MKRNSIFLVNSTHKTKPWWTTLSVLIFVFVPFLLVWILTCEFNLLDTNWLIARNASVWHGAVTNENINILADKYAIFRQGGRSELFTLLSGYLGSDTQWSIVSYKTFFNPIVLAPLFGLLIWSIVYPMIFNATKVSGLDVIPFSSAIGILMISVILSGLIPHWDNNMIVLYWIIRLFIGFILMAIAFIIANSIVNKYLASRPYATDVYFGYKVNDEATKLTRKQLQENIDIFKHNKEKDKTYVEIEEKGK